MPYENDRLPPLPQRWPGSVVGNQVIEEPIANFLTRYPRTFASATVTITGSVATSDVLHLTFTLPALPGGAVVVIATAGAGDTVITLAQRLAAAICNNPALQSYGAYATSLGGVVTIRWPGPLGNNVVLSQSVTPGSEVETISGQLTGGSGPVIPFNTFRFQYHKHLFEFQANRPVSLPGSVVAALAHSGSPIS